MGVITGYSRRTAAIGSGGGGGAINTIYSASDTIIDDARTVTLKTGTTATQNFQIKNSNGTPGYYFDGAGTLNFGSSTKFVQPNIYLDSALTDQMIIYRGAAGFIYIDPSSYDIAAIGASTRVTIHANTAALDARGDGSSYNLLTTSGTIRAGFLLQSGASGLYMNNASGTRILNIETQNGYGTIVGNWAIGLAHNTSPSGRLHVKGSGSTSATTTALFQNSASVSALKIKDDLYCIFRAKDAAIPDGDLSNNELSFYIEEATNDLHFKVKFSTGTVKSGKINLT